MLLDPVQPRLRVIVADGLARPSRWLQVVAAAACVASLLPLVVLGLQLSPTADDYVNHLRLLDTGGPIGFTVQLYQFWTGRILSSLILSVAIANLKLTPLLGALLGIAYIACGAVLVLMLYDVFELDGAHLPRGVVRTLWSVAVAVAGLWIATRQFLSETVFWVTGGVVYVLPLSFGLAWLVVAYRLAHSASTRRLPTVIFIVWSLTSLCLGTAHEELSCALAFAAALLMLKRWRQMRYKVDGALLNLLVGFFGLAVGTLVLLAAPGNYVRADYAPHPELSDPLGILQGVFQLTVIALAPFSASYLVGLVVGAVLFASGAAGSRATARTLFAWGMVLIGAGAASLLPLVPLVNFAGPRTFFILSVLTWAGAAIVGYAICLDLALRRRQLTGRTQSYSLIRLTGLAMLGLYLLQISNEIQLASFLQRADGARSQALASIENKDTLVEVAPLNVTLPMTVHYNDVGPDPNGFINQAVAREFGLAAIRLQQQAAG